MPQSPSQQSAPPLQSRFAADPEMAELIDLFLTDLPGRVGSIRSAAAAAQADELRRLAHQLRGSASVYGFPVLGQAAGKVESRLLELADEDARRALGQIGRELDELIELCDRACRGRR